MLKIHITDLSYDPKPYDFDGFPLMIRPWPYSKSELKVRQGTLIMSGENSLECFIECLCAWPKGFIKAEREDGTEVDLECTREIKQALFQNQLYPKLVYFVLDKSKYFQIRKEEEEKNFTSGSGTISES